MRHRDYLNGLVELGRGGNPDERRALFRQSLATLASAIETRHAVPLEGLDPELLRASVASCLRTGLFDDLTFLSGPSRAAALYEIAAALMPGEEKRDLGRKVFVLLLEGDADTFIALATQVAQGSRRALSGPEARARVGLCLDLPVGFGAHADKLALALVSRQELEQDWLSGPASGPLPSRRLAAKLLERAAREAARRQTEGDDSGFRVFELGSVRQTFARLLQDRESLVWRHVASARGLLSQASEAHRRSLEDGLSPSLSPTEWRRSATSLAARLTIDAEGTHARIEQILKGPLQRRDPGLASAIMLGLPRAAETEPTRVEHLLPLLVREGRVPTIEAFIAFRREVIWDDFGTDATRIAKDLLDEALEQQHSDDGFAALLQGLRTELEPRGLQTSLPDQVAEAVRKFAVDGPAAAHRLSGKLVESAQGTLGTLLLSKGDERGRRQGFHALRELDTALLESTTLFDLTRLMGPSSVERKALEQVVAQLHDWLVGVERGSDSNEGLEHPILRQRRLRALLHAVDSGQDGDSIRNTEHRDRRTRSAAALLHRVRQGGPSPLRRVITAGAARAIDGLVRHDQFAVSDALILAAKFATDNDDVHTFAEATMLPEIEATLEAYVDLGDTLQYASRDGRGDRACIDALVALAQALPVANSPRVEALRSALLMLARSLESVAVATSLRHLAEGTESQLLAPFEGAVQTIVQLTIGARRRIGLADNLDVRTAGESIRKLNRVLERAVHESSTDGVLRALQLSLGELSRELWPTLFGVVARVLRRIEDLPLESEIGKRESFQAAARNEAPLPPWLPPSRSLGGFYVLRPLGTGAVGSVFVARRFEERSREDAQRFALKVPEYTGAAARTLSEQEFMTMFRREAGALLSLPQHTNLAGFVTFDAGAQPKPILVMELVEGPTLEHLLELEALNLPRAFEILEGIGAGISAMHREGIGHLDVKPSNVILRDPDGLAGPEPPQEAVLVDFGLAGRHVRPGCGTGEYAAPEIWTTENTTIQASPMPADVYAFGCVIYETLMGTPLFQGPTEMALIGQHVGHDGSPEPIQELLRKPMTRSLGNLLHGTLRHKPENRLSLADVLNMLAKVRDELVHASWPVQLVDPSEAVLSTG